MKKTLITFLTICLFNATFSASEVKNDELSHLDSKYKHMKDYFEITGAFAGTVPSRAFKGFEKVVEKTGNIISEFKTFKSKKKNKNKILNLDPDKFTAFANGYTITPKITTFKRLIKIEWSIYTNHISGANKKNKSDDLYFVAKKTYIHK